MRPHAYGTAGTVGTAMSASLETDGRKLAARVLVVEDEREIAALIAYQLTREGIPG